MNNKNVNKNITRIVLTFLVVSVIISSIVNKIWELVLMQASILVLAVIIYWILRGNDKN